MPLNDSFGDIQPGELNLESLTNWHMIRGIIILCITIGIIISNIVNLIVWKKNKKMPSTTRLFLINLSTSDLMVGVFATAPAVYPAFQGTWPYGHIWCQISGVIHGMSVTLSIWSIAMVGIDRYLAATKPHDYKTLISRKRCFIIVTFMWISAFITFVSPIFTKKDFIYYKYKDSEAFCGLHWEYPLYCIITGCYIPIASACILIFTSIQIYRNLISNRKRLPDKKHKTQSQGTDNYNMSRKITVVNQRALLILITASTVYFIFWGPYVVLFISQSFYQNIQASNEVHFSVMWIANMNSMVNVIVYSLTNKSFQNEARELFIKRDMDPAKSIALAQRHSTTNDNPDHNSDELDLNVIKQEEADKKCIPVNDIDPTKSEFTEKDIAHVYMKDNSTAVNTNEIKFSCKADDTQQEDYVISEFTELEIYDQTDIHINVRL